MPFLQPQGAGAVQQAVPSPCRSLGKGSEGCSEMGVRRVVLQQGLGGQGRVLGTAGQRSTG